MAPVDSSSGFNSTSSGLLNISSNAVKLLVLSSNLSNRSSNYSNSSGAVNRNSDKGTSVWFDILLVLAIVTCLLAIFGNDEKKGSRKHGPTTQPPAARAPDRQWDANPDNRNSSTQDSIPLQKLAPKTSIAEPAPAYQPDSPPKYSA